VKLQREKQLTGADAPQAVATVGRMLWRGVRFGGGFFVGLLAIPAVVAGAGALLVLAVLVARRPAPPEGPVSVYTSSGAKISRAGAVTVVWEGRDEITRQICRGRCDDLAFRFEEPEAIEARDASGRNLVRQRPGWAPAWLSGQGADRRPDWLELARTKEARR